MVDRASCGSTLDTAPRRNCQSLPSRVAYSTADRMDALVPLQSLPGTRADLDGLDLRVFP